MVEERQRFQSACEASDTRPPQDTPQEKEISSDVSSRISEAIDRVERSEAKSESQDQKEDNRTIEQRLRDVEREIVRKEVQSRVHDALDKIEREPIEKTTENKGPQSRISDAQDEFEKESIEDTDEPSISDPEEKLSKVQRELDALKESGVDVTNVDDALKELYKELAENTTPTDQEGQDNLQTKEPDDIENIKQREHTAIEDYSKQVLRYAYEQTNGAPPEVSIESMKEVDELIKKHEDALDMQYVSKNYERCEKYVAVHDDWSKTQIELAEVYDVSQSQVGNWRSSYEQGLVRVLRSLEEDMIVQEWAKTQTNEGLSEAVRDYSESKRITDLGSLPQDFSQAKEIKPKDAKEGFGRITETQLDHERLVKGFEKMYPKDRNDERIFHSNLSTVYTSNELKILEESLAQNKELVESELQRKLGLEHTENIVKVATIEGRMYMWIRDQSKNDMLNAWSSQYFYPKDSRELSQMTDCTLEKLGLDPKKADSIEHYNKIMDQILNETDSSKIQKSKYINEKRIQGESLRFQMDVNGIKTDYLNERIERITGINGQGGIRNPRFIEGKQLEFIRARLMATANSDFHLQEDGRGEYYEESWERVGIFKQTLSELGEMDVSVIKRKGDYKANITSSVGNPLIFWGCPFGDKSIVNKGLPKEFIELSEETHQKYGEDLIVQDGSIDKRGRVSWVRHVAIHAGNKTDDYGFQSTITTRETNLIQANGEYDEYMNRYVLDCNTLERLRHSEEVEIAESAKVLQQAIDDTPSNMIETEADIFRSQGIGVITKATVVKYYTKTGKVSVAWVAKTETIEDSIKWVKSCPPNDVVKRAKAYDFLKARGEQPQWTKENPRAASS